MNHDVAVLADGREIPVDDFGSGELLVLCQRGGIKRIRHFTRAQPKTSGFRERTSKPLTASQLQCVEGL